MKILKKAFGICCIGLGVGILLVLLLPVTGWLFLVGVAITSMGFAWLAC